MDRIEKGMIDQSWKEMEVILDREMPQKRRRGLVYWMLGAAGILGLGFAAYFGMLTQSNLPKDTTQFTSISSPVQESQPSMETKTIHSDESIMESNVDSPASRERRNSSSINNSSLSPQRKSKVQNSKLISSDSNQEISNAFTYAPPEESVDVNTSKTVLENNEIDQGDMTENNETSHLDFSRIVDGDNIRKNFFIQLLELPMHPLVYPSTVLNLEPVPVFHDDKIEPERNMLGNWSLNGGLVTSSSKFFRGYYLGGGASFYPIRKSKMSLNFSLNYLSYHYDAQDIAIDGNNNGGGLGTSSPGSEADVTANGVLSIDPQSLLVKNNYFNIDIGLGYKVNKAFDLSIGYSLYKLNQAVANDNITSLKTLSTTTGVPYEVDADFLVQNNIMNTNPTGLYFMVGYSPVKQLAFTVKYRKGLNAIFGQSANQQFEQILVRSNNRTLSSLDIGISYRFD